MSCGWVASEKSQEKVPESPAPAMLSELPLGQTHNVRQKTGGRLVHSPASLPAGPWGCLTHGPDRLLSICPRRAVSGKVWVTLHHRGNPATLGRLFHLPLDLCRLRSSQSAASSPLSVWAWGWGAWRKAAVGPQASCLASLIDFLSPAVI